MIFQQPQSSLNPVFKIADQIAEVLEIHQEKERTLGTGSRIIETGGHPGCRAKAMLIRMKCRADRRSG